MSDNGRSATDIITYVGIPLAVLGVLPILYNTFATLVSLSHIKRMLRHSRLTALTRSDVVNRVIEIELPRYAAMPFDRFQDRSEYWSVSRHPSSIPGGSWTTFNWKTNAIGIKTQRVEYADQVRQPQVDVAFDELVCYLLDLGAVPDPRGWKLLRSTGLWTPVGCSLMMSPDGREKALTVAPLDDSDENLSLAVAWSSSWTTRDHAHLPPYWVRLPHRPIMPASVISVDDVPTDGEQKTDHEAGDKVRNNDGSGQRVDPPLVDPAEDEVSKDSQKDITCQVTMSGLATALIQEDHLLSAVSINGLYIDHIRLRQAKSDGIWFASAVTAYGTSNQTILWNYKIPDDILLFSRRDTVPCGIMVMLGVVDESKTPEWATQHNDNEASLNAFVRRGQEQRAAYAAEARMSPAERAQAVSDRMRRESQQRMNDMQDKMMIDRQRSDQRMMEALQSPKWEPKLVAEHTLAWLKSRDLWDNSFTLKEVVGYMLHRMVLDGQFSSSICRMLDVWRAWADVGGMKRSDYQVIQDDLTTFAHATLLIALIKDTSTALEGTLSMDLQECLRLWRKVRLG
ncbi:hypothetical protein G7046_g2933 [Stylonectria norvegica]|nr:hypothetical protein G7046_g2933 [Stylonectria norvegica]